jgi:hypothetical protein
MDWEEFKTRLGSIQNPQDNPEYLDKFISAQNSIHLIIGKWTSENFKLILDTVSVLESRGAKRCDDYIITGEMGFANDLEPVLKSLSIHTTDEFMSQEDFIDIEIG